MTEDVKKIDVFTNRIPSNSLDEIKNIVNDNVSAFERNFKTSYQNLPVNFIESFEYGLNLADSGKHFCSIVLFLYIAERRFFDVSIIDISTILGISESHVKKIGSEIGNWPDSVLKFIDRLQKDSKYFYFLSESVIETVEKLLPEKLLDSSFRIKILFKNRNIADNDESILKLLRIQNKKDELVHDRTAITNELLLRVLDYLKSIKNCLLIGEPGVGKTIFTYFLSQELIDNFGVIFINEEFSVEDLRILGNLPSVLIFDDFDKLNDTLKIKILNQNLPIPKFITCQRQTIEKLTLKVNLESYQEINLVKKDVKKSEDIEFLTQVADHLFNFFDLKLSDSDKDFKLDLLQLIVSKSEGLILYIREVFYDCVKNNNRLIGIEFLENIPNGIQGYVAYFYEREFFNDSSNLLILYSLFYFSKNYYFKLDWISLDMMITLEKYIQRNFPSLQQNSATLSAIDYLSRFYDSIYQFSHSIWPYSLQFADKFFVESSTDDMRTKKIKLIVQSNLTEIFNKIGKNEYLFFEMLKNEINNKDGIEFGRYLIQYISIRPYNFLDDFEMNSIFKNKIKFFLQSKEGINVIGNTKSYLPGASSDLKDLLRDVMNDLIEGSKYKEVKFLLSIFEEIYESTDNLESKSLLFFMMAKYYGSIRDIPKATEYIKQAIEIDTHLGDYRGLSSTVGMLGDLCIFDGQFLLAKQYYEQVERISTRILHNPFSDDVAYNSMRLGDYYFSTGENEKSLGYFKKAYYIYRENKTINGIIGALTNTAEVQHYLGKSKSSKNNLAQAKLYALRTGKKAFLERIEGLEKIIENKYEELTEQYDIPFVPAFNELQLETKRIEFYEKIKNGPINDESFINYKTYLEICFRLGDFKEVLKYYELLKENPVNQLRSIYYFEMGAFAFFFGKYEDAYKLLLSANQYCVTGTHPWDYVSKVKLLFSAILVFKNEFNDAKRILDFMLDKQIDNETKILIHYLYAELYERNKDFTQSRNFFNLANQMNDQFKIMDKNVKIIDISRSIGHGLLPRMYPIVEESKVIENENENTNKNKELLQEIFNAERLLDQKRYSECIEFLMPLLKKYSIGELKSDEKERYLKLYLYAGHSYKEIYYSSLNINYLRQSLLYYKKGLALLISLKKEINNLVQLRVEFLFNLGFHCCPIYGLETALKFFERALYIVSSSNTFQDKKFYMFRIHGSKGKVFLDSLKYNEAIESLTMALEFKDDSILEIKNYLPLIYRELGIAYFETNNLKKAKEAFLEAASRFQAIGMIDRVHSVEIYLDQLNNIP